VKQVDLTKMTVHVPLGKPSKPGFAPVMAGKCKVQRGKKQPRK